MSMYEKFDLYLKEGEYWYEEYWYEEGCDIAGEMLSKFTQEDWDRLTKEIFDKSLDYQEKVAYCTYDTGNKNELEFLLFMAKNTKNSMIFEMCIASLQDFIKLKTKLKLLSDTQLMDLISKELEKEEDKQRNMYTQFLRKLNNA